MVSSFAFDTYFCGLEKIELLSGARGEVMFSMCTTKGALESIKYLFNSQMSCAFLEGFLGLEDFKNRDEGILFRFALLALKIGRASEDGEKLVRIFKIIRVIGGYIR